MMEEEDTTRLGKVKNYLRYAFESQFGLITSSRNSTSINLLHQRNTDDRYIAVPVASSVYIWDLKTKVFTNELINNSDKPCEVSQLECFHGGNPRTNFIAVGYMNGSIRLFEYETGELKSVYNGHRTAVTALSFDKSGTRLASGAKDCNIVIWDISADKGLFCLKGHKNSITKLEFLFNDKFQKDLLVSSSMDTVSTIKFWDLSVQHCFKTIPGNASGAWSFTLIKNGTQLIVGCGGAELQVYSIDFFKERQEANLENLDLAESDLEFGISVKHIGNILRNSPATSNKVEQLILDQSESILLSHSGGKDIEIYEIRDAEEVSSYIKKRSKKERRKSVKRKIDDNIELEDSVMTNEFQDTIEPVEAYFNRKYEYVKIHDKMRSLCIKKMAFTDESKNFKVVVACTNNKILTYNLCIPRKTNKAQIDLVSSIDTFGHRNEIRSVAISKDDSLVVSCSKESLKVWQSESKTCINTIKIENGSGCCFPNCTNLESISEKRYVLVSTKKGELLILDLQSAQLLQTIQVSNSPIQSICTLPDGSGIVCGGDDQTLRFYTYIKRVGSEHLSLIEDRHFSFDEGITSIKISPNSRFVAVALLDSTIRVHYLDTLKYFLTLYGHKFPVLSMDISDDSTMLASGSTDKNIKIWGLDFGDCHKSIFAHEESITCVRFIPKTHYIFTSGRDKCIKQWDADHFNKIQMLKKHHSDVLCLAISRNGKYVVSGAQDRSLHWYRKTDEIVVPDLEEEAERELEDEKNTFEKQESIIPGEVNLETGFALKTTVETVKSTDRLMEAIDIFAMEQDKDIEYKKLCDLAKKESKPFPPAPERDPMLLTTQTDDYRHFMLETLRRIRTSDLEGILVTLPFDYVRKFLVILVILIDLNWGIELMVRCISFLLRVNSGQVISCRELVPVLAKLRSVILNRTRDLRDLTGFDLAALEHLNNKIRARVQ